MKIVKSEINESYVKLTLWNGVEIHLSSNEDYINLHFSYVTSIEIRDKAANCVNIDYVRSEYAPTHR